MFEANRKDLIIPKGCPWNRDHNGVDKFSVQRSIAANAFNYRWSVVNWIEISKVLNSIIEARQNGFYVMSAE